MNSKLSVNDRLKDTREYLGLTIESVSNSLQISIENLLKVENGQKVPSKDELQKLSKLYKHPVSYFLKGEYEQNAEVGLLARTVADLSEKDRDHILRFSNILSKMK
ncbi:helix-turn-helix domain-containing protein [Priestia megaterium]|uniref:helix-turn-helix domain-containing protein n=1 Tax=Priestia megaterium TaxID=1404 RepID=UPI001CDC1948|nr:helix-turn-helix transcriptional regulator [Priestia megaterium]MCA4158022.1 helix-turn-helix domain-containing protein [Priestia megaterium]